MEERSQDGVLRGKDISKCSSQHRYVTHWAVSIFCEVCHENLLLLIKDCSLCVCVWGGSGDVLKVKVCNDDAKWWFPYKNTTSKIWLSDTLSWVGEQHTDGHAYWAGNGLCGEVRAAAPGCQARSALAMASGS